MLVIGVTGWPTIARLVRAEFLRLSATDFATAARALGLPWRRIVFRHLLPNGMAPVLVAAAFGMAGAILIESGLAFLRLGDGSVASWGQVLRVGRETGALHLILAPGLLIFLTVTMMNLLAQGLRDAMDPRKAS
jgi:peptide/nickel transport system permease protein